MDRSGVKEVKSPYTAAMRKALLRKREAVDGAPATTGADARTVAAAVLHQVHTSGAAAARVHLDPVHAASGRPRVTKADGSSASNARPILAGVRQVTGRAQAAHHVAARDHVVRVAEATCALAS